MKMRKNMEKILAAALVVNLVLGIPVFAAGSGAEQTQDQQMEALQKENEELKSQLEKLMKELEEQKAGQEKQPELPENVANADTTVQYTDKVTVKLVQEALNAAGYNCGNPDGVAGKKTAEAISNYETAQGLVVNGMITDQLLESMGLADQLEEQAKKEAEKASYSSDYSYDQLARNPDTYDGMKVKFSGKVLQVGEGSNAYMRLAINSSYDTILFVTFDATQLSYRLLENDQVTVYGEANGVYSYESVSGATITIPWVVASIIELK